MDDKSNPPKRTDPSKITIRKSGLPPEGTEGPARPEPSTSPEPEEFVAPPLSPTSVPKPTTKGNPLRQFSLLGKA
ncbi:MAG: hypothetical protein K1X67_07345, partial [Fimbriimonadaceae bacterium]|nr:hypothetical protein [Fimbriimonadaceae bacterium]